MAEATVDYLNFKSTEFYKNLKKYDQRPDIVYPKNILAYQDDVLFAWDHGEHCLIVLLTKTLMVDEVQIVQKLRPTEMILTEVVRLVLNHQNTRIAICCRNDVYVMDLPPRSGRHGQFKGSASEVTCSCRRLYVQCALTTIRQVYWHPDLDYDYYLAILSSDDLLQISDVQVGGFVDTWVLSSGAHNRLPSLESIGEVAVDFHFIPQSSLKHILPVYTDKVKKEIEPMEWPALILYGNGDVVMIDLSVRHEGRKYGKTTSPLLMYPSADDNYGVDCSAILILDGCLPIVVIASSTGIIYHSILLNHLASDYQNYDIKKSNSIMSSSNSASDAVYVLHVIESIDLDIGLNLGSNSDDTIDEITSSPIKLIEDHTCNMRYFAIHISGVHSVNLPIVNELGIFFSKSYKSVDLPPQALLNFKKIKCVVEYIVCCQITGKKPSPVVGAISIECPTTVLVVLFPDNIFSLRVTSWFISTPSINEPAGSPNSRDTLIEEVKSVSFQESVENILKPDCKSVPIFKMGDDFSPTPQQCLELLARATSYFRETIIPRHEQAAQLIRTKARMLLKMKGRQLEDLKPLENVRSELKDKACYLAEKYEDINEKQIELAKRAERVLRVVKTRERGLTKCEKIIVDNLLVIQNTLDGLTTEVNAIRLRETTQDEIISTELQERLNNVYLTDNHLHIIGSNLATMNSDINNVVVQIQDAEAELGFDIRLKHFPV